MSRALILQPYEIHLQYTEYKKLSVTRAARLAVLRAPRRAKVVRQASAHRRTARNNAERILQVGEIRNTEHVTTIAGGRQSGSGLSDRSALRIRIRNAADEVGIGPGWNRQRQRGCDGGNGTISTYFHMKPLDKLVHAMC